jgi:hypothetical protein
MSAVPGDRTASLASAITLIQERGGPAQICVIARGQVVDQTFECRPDASVSDAILAACC